MSTAFRTSNPVFSQKSFGGFVGTRAAPTAQQDTRVMTVQGTVDRTAILLAILTLTAIVPWRIAFGGGDPAALMSLLGLGLVGGLVLAMVTVFKQSWARVTAPLYAACEGLVLGGVSAIYEARYQGIVLQAVGLTLGTLAVMLIAYKTKAIRATEKFKLGVIAATGAIALVYMLSWILGMFGINIGFIHSTGLLGIGISLVIVGVAALNLVLDFDLIEQGARQGAPKYMEWYGGFGVLVTLVWLYLEILRLLSLLNRRRD
jgi:uncharacterized YccA/Bax inhibitor family protein